MIRELEFAEIPKVIAYLKENGGLASLSDKQAKSVNHVYAAKVVGKCLESNNSFISFNKDNKINGVALGLIVPNIWQPLQQDIHLLAAISDTPTVGGKLFIKWHNAAIANPFTDRILVDKLPKTNIGYEKLGYTQLRITYIL
jgi:hypothetical protein